MPAAERRPLAPMPSRRIPIAAESRVSFSMKLKPCEIELAREAAAARGLGHTTFARECFLTGLRMALVEDQMKGAARVTA